MVVGLKQAMPCIGRVKNKLLETYDAAFGHL